MSELRLRTTTPTIDIYIKLAQYPILADRLRERMRQELFRRVLIGKEYMLDQWDAKLGLPQIARHACLSPYHFHRTFREVYGPPPMKWFRKLKFEKAKELLRGGAMTVTEVALQCGFSDVFTFSKAFKREWGMNPSEV